MPTLSIYNRFVNGDPVGPSHNRLMTSEFGGGQPPELVGLSPADGGSSYTFNWFFLDQGIEAAVPFKGHRYAGATVEANCYAIGNNTVYAIATSITEIAPSAGPPVVSEFRHGAEPATSAIHDITFPSAPFTGKYRITFPGPRLDGASFVVAPKGTTRWLYANSTLDDIAQAIHDLPFYFVSEGNLQPAPGVWWPLLVVTGTATAFRINYQTPPHGANAGPIPLPTVESEIDYKFGYQVTLALDGNGHTFADLFKSANGPAFLDFLLYLPGGSGGLLTAQIPIIPSDPGLAPVAQFTADRQTCQPGESITFTDQSTNTPTAWDWDFGDGQGFNTHTPVHIYANAGTYTVRLTVANASGSGTITKLNYIVVSTTPGPPGAGDLDASGNLPATVFDGDYNELAEIEWHRREMSDEHPTLEVYHQTHEVKESGFVPVVIGTPGGVGGFFAKDSVWESIASNVIRFVRTSHNIPPDFQFNVAVGKNIQAANYTDVGGTLIDIQVVDFSEKRIGICFVSYFLRGVYTPPFPRVPFLRVQSVVGGPKYFTDLGSQFPTNGAGRFTNNYEHPTFIDGDVRRVLGNLYARYEIWA